MADRRPSPTDLARELIAALFGDLSPDDGPAEVIARTRSNRAKLSVPLDGARASRLPAIPSAAPATVVDPIGCPKEIIQVLREAGHRMTGEQLCASMEDHGFKHSEGKIKMTAAILYELGMLTNEQKANPKGYGLPEWA